jgi:hypothetical protein
VKLGSHAAGLKVQYESGENIENNRYQVSSTKFTTNGSQRSLDPYRGMIENLANFKEV